MTFAYAVRPEKRGALAAPTHVDGTARLQTVDREANPRYWGLIREFGDLTGVPAVVNTSFNDNEPIVCRPEEAIDCFLRTRMDTLVLGDFLIRRPASAEARGGRRSPRMDRATDPRQGCRPEPPHPFLRSRPRLHVLVLNEYFPPDTSATAKNAALVVEALAERHRVTVLCGRPSYDPTERHPPYLLRREVRGNLAIERVGSTAFPRFRMKRRVSNYLTYLGLAVPRALTIRCDVVLAMTDPPIEGIAGAFVARFPGGRSSTTFATCIPTWPLEETSFAREAGRALGNAASVGPAARRARHRAGRRHARAHFAKGVDPARIAIVRDAVPFPETLPLPIIPWSARFAANSVLCWSTRAIWAFMARGRRCFRPREMLEPDGVGPGVYRRGRQERQNRSDGARCRNVRFLPFRPADEVPYVMAAGDLHVVTVKRGLEGVVVPSKVYTILAAGRPLLAVATDKTEVARFAERDGCGLAVDPDDPAAVAEAVRSVLATRKALRTWAAGPVSSRRL